MFKTPKLLSLGFLFISLSLFGQNYHTFSGVVKDSISGMVLNGVDVVVDGLSTGTLTNDAGEFLLYLESGEYKILFSFAGYQTQIYNLDLDRDVQDEIKLLEAQKANKNSFSWLRRIEPKNNQQIAVLVNKEEPLLEVHSK